MNNVTVRECDLKYKNVVHKLDYLEAKLDRIILHVYIGLGSIAALNLILSYLLK